MARCCIIAQFHLHGAAQRHCSVSRTRVIAQFRGRSRTDTAMHACRHMEINACSHVYLLQPKSLMGWKKKVLQLIKEWGALRETYNTPMMGQKNFLPQTSLL